MEISPKWPSLSDLIYVQHVFISPQLANHIASFQDWCATSSHNSHYIIRYIHALKNQFHSNWCILNYSLIPLPGTKASQYLLFLMNTLAKKLKTLLLKSTSAFIPQKPKSKATFLPVEKYLLNICKRRSLFSPLKNSNFGLFLLVYCSLQPTHHSKLHS